MILGQLLVPQGQMALFASEAGAFITDQTLAVDGGLTAA